MKANRWTLIFALCLGCDSSTGKVGVPCQNSSDCGTHLKCVDSTCSNGLESNKSANPDPAHAIPLQGDRIGEGVTGVPELRSSNIHANSKVLANSDAVLESPQPEASPVGKPVDRSHQAEGSQSERFPHRSEKTSFKHPTPEKKLSARILRRMKVRLSTPEVEGPMEASMIYRIVRAHINEIRSCYKRGLQRDEQLRGKLTFHFTVYQTGKIRGMVEEKNSFVDTEVSDCIGSAITRWRFPKPKSEGLINVIFPMELSLR